MECQEKEKHSNLLIGAGIYDITGPAAESGMWGYAKKGQCTTGIHMRLRSRAFVFECKRTSNIFGFVSADLGCITECVRQGVLEKLNNHFLIPEKTFHRGNITISAVHTHCSPGGLSQHMMYSIHPPLKGFDKQNFDCVVYGITESIARAYANRQEGFIRMAKGFCIGASVNRSVEAYLANPKEERDKYEFDTDKEMVLWRLDGTNGFPIGMINWFAVHPTSMGSWYTLITGDNKGYASYQFEMEQGNNHLLDKPRSFVAAFAQTNEGDVSPNINGPRDIADESKDFERMVTVANIQLQTAKILYEEAGRNAIIDGPLKMKDQYIDYSQIQLSPKFHNYKECSPQTSTGCVGISMLSGTLFDGRGLNFLSEGIKWGDYKKVTLIPDLQKDQKEKPVVFPASEWGLSPRILPLQLVLIGNVALAAIPFEATTMAGRRLRHSISRSLSRLQISEVILAGLSNSYCGYMTTREEYAIQRYEGASTHFGPNQLCATKQQFDLLAKAIIGDFSLDSIEPPELPFGKMNFSLPVIHDGILWSNTFGDIVKGHDVQPIYRCGDTVKVQFHGGHPKNNLRIQHTFLEIHRFVNDQWVIQSDDGDPNTFFEWKRWSVDASRITIKWFIPSSTPAGIYRIKHNGDFRTGWRQSVTGYIGYSSPFEVKPSIIDNNEKFR